MYRPNVVTIFLRLPTVTAFRSGLSRLEQHELVYHLPSDGHQTQVSFAMWKDFVDSDLD